MKSISLQHADAASSKYTDRPRFSFSAAIQWYKTFVATQESNRMVWFVYVILVLPCAIMVPAFCFLYLVGASNVWFAGFAVLLFFVNLILHVAETKSKIYVPVFHATVATIILISITLFLFSI